MSDWDAWIGRELVQEDVLDPALARRWCGTFDLSPPVDGIMPQGIHLCLCTPEAPQSALGEDGHPRRDDSATSFFPPIPLPRRMWAASNIAFLAPIRVGTEIKRVSRIASIAEKEGSTGKLGFVDVEHVTSADGAEAVRETQTLVYRDSVSPDAPMSPPGLGQGTFDITAWDAHTIVTPDPRLLFRFSALTFNTHRIHYDLPYARDVERYRGLVVHGPLMASLLLQLAARELGENKLKSFSFRAVSPAIADEVLHLAMRRGDDGVELGTFASDGRQCVKANATF
ncbi:MaoC family dehydratase N-terminal domain-containing protein [Altererythrobacter arenosus]|uniref:MaoC family dehydratase N-terminal domain-containing protein n=1 Tax=Altererythrobacter arenosus TaxID=3032592 RepID=A0ABY8G1L1_9SPHN|nr:MaoC family dehydratase N-terminal domain-containing protein [Altererythrobacter sp. CAU 1644]WFL78469.1 MaoC family dehydratase N-terminal domain-containing protein [Altererythrobacter sp. CAU 1644]